MHELLCINSKLPNEVLNIVFDFTYNQSLPESISSELAEETEKNDEAYDVPKDEISSTRITDAWQLRLVCRHWKTLFDQFCRLTLNVDGSLTTSSGSCQCLTSNDDGSLTTSSGVWLSSKKHCINNYNNGSEWKLQGFSVDELRQHSSIVSCIAGVKLNLEFSERNFVHLHDFMNSVADLLKQKRQTSSIKTPLQLSLTLSDDRAVQLLTSSICFLSTSFSLQYPDVQLTHLNVPLHYRVLNVEGMCTVLQYLLSGTSRVSELSSVNLSLLLLLEKRGCFATMSATGLERLFLEAMPLNFAAKESNNAVETCVFPALSILPRHFPNLRFLKLAAICCPLNYMPLHQLEQLQQLELDLLHSAIQSSNFAAESISLETLIADCDVPDPDDQSLSQSQHSLPRLQQTDILNLGQRLQQLQLFGFTAAHCRRLCNEARCGRFRNLKSLMLSLTLGSRVSVDDLVTLLSEGVSVKMTPQLERLMLATCVRCASFVARSNEQSFDCTALPELVAAAPKTLKQLELELEFVLEQNNNDDEPVLTMFAVSLRSLFHALRKTSSLQSFSASFAVRRDVGKQLLVELRTPLVQKVSHDESLDESLDESQNGSRPRKESENSKNGMSLFMDEVKGPLILLEKRNKFHLIADVPHESTTDSLHSSTCVNVSVNFV